jgi:hypothetical protein
MKNQSDLLGWNRDTGDFVFDGDKAVELPLCNQAGIPGAAEGEPDEPIQPELDNQGINMSDVDSLITSRLLAFHNKLIESGQLPSPVASEGPKAS